MPAEKKNILDYTHSCGAHIYTPDTRTLEMVLTKDDECLIEVSVVNVVQINMRLDSSPEDFFKNDMAGSFMAKMASFLGISMDRIRIVNVR